MRNSTRIAATVASAGLVAAAVAAPASAAPSDTIFDIVEGSAAHTTLEAVLVATGLNATLDGRRQFTLFAPTDQAFADLEAANEGITAKLLAEPGLTTLKSILLYHVAPGERFSGDVVGSSKIRTMSKQFASVAVDAGPPLVVSVGGASLNLGFIDLDASNGVVHVLDEVMLPPM